MKKTDDFLIMINSAYAALEKHNPSLYSYQFAYGVHLSSIFVQKLKLEEEWQCQ